MKMIVEKQVECRLAGETEVLGENLPRRHFCPSQNPTWPDPVLNPIRRSGKPATNRLSYGAAMNQYGLCRCASSVKTEYWGVVWCPQKSSQLYILIFVCYGSVSL
jgi:hypothetical protein